MSSGAVAAASPRMVMVPVLGPDGKTVYQKIATSSLSSFSLLTEAKQRMAEDLKKKKEEEEERERVDM